MENNLEIFLLTYNRSRFLNETLSKICDYLLPKYKLTVCDNCSTDDTKLIVESYQQKYFGLLYQRNHINIGADANYLQAIQLSKSKYTWVLCDDDIYDFTKFHEIIYAINNFDFNLIVVGSSKLLNWHFDNKNYSLTSLIKEKKFPVYSILNFWPATIYKTSFMQANIQNAYLNIENLLCQATYANMLINNNESVYFISNPVVYAGEQQVDYTKENLYKGWIKTCININDLALREICFFSLFRRKNNFRTLTYLAFCFRKYKFNLSFVYYLYKILHTLKFTYFIILYLCSKGILKIPLLFLIKKYRNKEMYSISDII